ncbi:cation channel family transporter (macronuclear) [Tetrahymena thermophila SB210]|uniref:Cation channel family transporter n=1 Tax=Tetrahymena thermophila (strain SB210) TaxID=312017 RepID=Q22BI8_TETTS|nr:cation channel family transporter [Tetrahymena thermophila SB210]EAR82678.2 cation channel family transporter [Tetrahymena thermophila SB210]|eukprot:XP_001030341.2 cation channel family transporter [Tetrahymena thermophila SB210]
MQQNQQEISKNSQEPQIDYVQSLNQKTNTKQKNKLLNESSATNTYRNSKIERNNKYNSPTQNTSSLKPKSQNAILQNPSSYQIRSQKNDENDNRAIDEQNIIKVNNKVRTIFRGGIIGMMQGKSKKKKTQISRNDSKNSLKEDQNKLSSLFFALEQLSRTERIQKAIRHFQDAINIRPVRHDIELHENRLIPFIYFWQTSSSWQMFLSTLAFLYPFCSFIEPPNRFVKDFNDNSILLAVETIIQGFIWLDIILEVFHRYHDKDKNLLQHYFKNFKFSTKIIVVLILLLDEIIFHSSFPQLTYRFSRFIRPFLIFYYSYELRRIFVSILKSLKQILQLVVFIAFLTLFIAIVGWRFIGNLDGSVQYDSYSSNFSNLFSAASNLYSLISFDSYPTLMIPAYTYSPIFSVYFVSYGTLLCLLFIPIPVSVVYNSFRMHRSKLVILDRFKQREALLSCFISLDFNNQKYIDIKIFSEFMSNLYLKKKSFLKKIKQLHCILDTNQTQSLSLNEFFEIIDVMEKNPRFQVPAFKDYKSWDIFRQKMNQKFYCKKIARSPIFDVSMLLILIINCAILFISMTSDNQSTQSLMDQIDDYFFYAYLLEFLIKVIGIGIEKYFEDSWNCFDFFMVVMSFLNIVLSTTLSFLQNTKSAKATKLLRLTKINRVFRIFKALRSIKFLSILLAGFELFYQVKDLLIKIFMCLPIVVRLIPIILVVYYIYTYIGLDNFNTNTFNYNQNSPYDQGYADFNNFYGAMLIYFQIMIEANWSSYIYDIAYKFDIPVQANILFISYDFIQNFILLSLVKGIVWEVFTVVNQELKEIELKNELLNNQNLAQEQKDFNNMVNLSSNNQEDLLKKENLQSNTQFKTHNFLKELELNNLQNENNNQKTSAPSQKISSDIKGILLYEKVLRNLQHLSHNNSIIYNEGQIPHSPKLIQSVYKNFTEESNNEKEIINERTSISENRNMIYLTKQIKNSPQKSKDNFLDKMLQKQDYFSQNLKNPPSSIENLDKNFGKQISCMNKKLSSQKRRRNSENLFDIQSQVLMKNSQNAIINKNLNKIDISFDDLQQNNQQIKKQSKEIINDNQNSAQPQLKHQKTKLESESCFSKNVSFALINKSIGDKSFLDRQDSSISQQPLKSESLMKSQIEGPYMLSEAPDQIAPQKSYTNLNSITQNDISEDIPQENEDINKITNEQVYWMKKRIKPLEYLKRLQKNKKKEKPDQKKENPLDLNELYIMSEDEETIKAYQKQVNDYIQDEDQDFSNFKSNSVTKEDANQSLNFQYMMKKALLSDSNMDMIKKLEIDYFQFTYGSYFNAFHEVKISPILKYESYIIYNLQRILRHKTLDCLFFFNVLINFEKNLSNILLRKGSLVKFVFQDSFGNWICFKEMNRNIYPCLLGQGPWTFYEKVFKKDDIYISRDFFQINQNQVLQNLIHKSYEQMRICAKCIDNDHPFLNINPQKSIFDFFTICSQNKNEDKVVSLTSQSNKKLYPDIPTSVQIYCKKVMMVVLSYVGESDEQQQEEDQDIDNNNKKKQGIFSNIFNQIETEQVRKRAKQNPKNINLNEIKQKQTQDKDKINEQSTLPMGFLVEMIQSIQDLINLYQVNLHLKVSEVINQKVFSKNYLDQIIQENNIIAEEINENKKKKMKQEQKSKKGIFKLFKKKENH